MASAIVHFTVGFIIVLVVLSVSPLARFRWIGAYLGGIWALIPDAQNIVRGPWGARLAVLHDTPHAELFFFHHTLDTPTSRAHNLELMFAALLWLGFIIVLVEWQSNRGRTATGT